MDDFYVVLPSNTPVPGNTASHFTVRLPHTLELDSTWTVALSSIIYPYSFPTIGIDEDEYVLIIMDNPKYKDGEDAKEKRFMDIRVPIASMQFHSVSHMQKTINALINDGFKENIRTMSTRQLRDSAPSSSESRVLRAAATNELVRDAPLAQQKELEREKPTQDKELERETPKIQKELEPETPQMSGKDKELEREEPPSRTPMDGVITPLHHSLPSNDGLTAQEKGEVLQDVLHTSLWAEGISNSDESKAQQQKENLSLADQARLNTARSVTERAWKEAVKLAKEADDFARWSQVDRHRAEQARRKAPNAPQVKQLYARLLSVAQRVQSHAEQTGEAAKKAAAAMRKMETVHATGKLKEARIEADTAKKALQEAKKYRAEIGPFWSRTSPETELGVRELANRVQAAVNSFLDPAEIVPRPAEEPAYPPGHPKLTELVKELAEEKDKELEKDLPQVEKELEKEPPKQAEKELEKEPSKQAEKELQKDGSATTTTKPDTVPLGKKLPKESKPIKQTEKIKEPSTSTFAPKEQIVGPTEFGAAAQEIDLDYDDNDDYFNEMPSKGLPKKDPKTEQIKQKENDKQHKSQFTLDDTFPDTTFDYDDINDGSFPSEIPPASSPVGIIVPQKKKTAPELALPKDEDADEGQEVEDPNAFYDQEHLYGANEIAYGNLPLLPTPQALVQEMGDDQREQWAMTTVENDGSNAGRSKWHLVKQKMAISLKDDEAVQFVFDEIGLRFLPILGKKIRYLKLSKQLAYVMGFDTNRVYENVLAKHAPDLSGGVRQIYVYAPKLIEDTIIGNLQAPLLRVVNVIGQPGVDVNEVIYTNEFFHQLQNKRISEIQIELQTPFGLYLRFHWGTCILTLHFRRKLF